MAVSCTSLSSILLWSARRHPQSGQTYYARTVAAKCPQKTSKFTPPKRKVKTVTENLTFLRRTCIKNVKIVFHLAYHFVILSISALFVSFSSIGTYLIINPTPHTVIIVLRIVLRLLLKSNQYQVIFWYIYIHAERLIANVPLDEYI